MLNRLRDFMQGRYGNDPLNIFLLIFGFVLSIFLTLFIPAKLYPLRSLSSVFYLIALFRSLSKNFPARQRENAKFLEKSEPWRKFIIKKLRQRQDKAHRYFNCPQCHRTLRVPVGRGKITITCPHCQRQFTKKT